MAAIRNSIMLQDRMSPVFRSIIKTMDHTLAMMQKVDQKAGQVGHRKGYAQIEKDIQRSNNELLKMQNNINRVSSSTDKAASSAAGLSKSFSGLNSGGFNLVNLASALYIISQIKDAVATIMQAPDLARATQARLGLFNESQYSNAELYKSVYETALSTRTGVAETGNLATRILISGAMTGPGAATGAIDMAGIINKALIAGGGTADENRRALLQLSQGLASGALQGDELRSIKEQTPYLAKIIAEGLEKIEPEKFSGISIGDLKKLGGEGELTADRLLKAFSAMEPEIDAAFAKMPRTFGQAMTQINTVWDYFLSMLATSDGALAIVNEKIWQFADWLSSSDGQAFLTELAMAFSLFVDAVVWGIDMIVLGMSWLRENSWAVFAAFIALGTIAVISGIAAAAAWIAAVWPILLVAVVIFIVIAVLMHFGITANQIIGGIAGGFAFLGMLIYDIVIWIVAILYTAIAGIWDILVFVAQAIITVIIAVAQIFVFLGEAIVTVAVIIYDVLYTVFMGALSIIEWVVIGIYALFVGMGEAVLAVIWAIASAIDAVFGSDLADSVEDWMDDLADSVITLEAELDPSGNFEDIGNQWQDSLNGISGMWTSDDTNFLDGIEDVAAAADSLLLDPTLGIDTATDWTVNPMDGWDAGYDWGSGIDLSGFNLDGVESILGGFNPDDVTMNGGTIDKVGSVGSIDSDVDISEEDIKLLRDIAARDFLINLQTITPTMTNNFGDIHEEADINKIMDKLTEMTEEALATSLVD